MNHESHAGLTRVAFVLKSPILRSLLPFTSLRCSVMRRWVALAFFFAFAVATAHPIVSPQSIELLCGSNGAMKLLVKSADSNAPDSAHMHCSLCGALDVPVPAISNHAFSSALAYATQRSPASALAALTRPPLPARGPPSIS